MSDETAEQVLTRVLLRHQPMLADDGKYIECQWCATDGWTATDAEDADHIAPELAAALREGGWLVEGETVTEWGVRAGGKTYAFGWPSATAARESTQLAGAVVVFRQRTRYPDRVTDWQPVEGGGDDA